MKLRIIIFLFLLQHLCAAAQPRKLNVSVDERMELLTTVQLLSGYKWLTKADLTYKNDVLRAFDGFRDHRAVSYYRAISGKFYGYAPVLWLCHYGLPSFEKTARFTSEDCEALQCDHFKDSLDTFMFLLKDFYSKSHFHTFFLNHASYYDSIAAPIKAEACKTDYTGALEKHFNSRMASYNVILSPLQMDAGFGPSVETKKGTALYAVVGPNYDSGPFPVFDKDALFKDLVIHEFCHSFCNPDVDRCYRQLQQDSCLLKPIFKEQKEQGYGTWKACLYEHLTRANEIVLNEIIFGRKVADELYKKQVEEDKWIYLEGLVPLARNGSFSNNAKFKKSTTPEFVQYFHKKSEQCR